MTVKKEFFLTSSPLEIYSMTLGNLETLSRYVSQTSSSKMVEPIITIYKEAVSSYGFMEYHQIREFVLSALEPMQTKVVNFT
jgi:hypothetical protein